MAETIKYLLDETRIPKVWYNITADLPSPPPPVLHPGTMKPVGPDDLTQLFPMSLIAQEAIAQFDLANDYPDVIIGCTGGGSNFAGIVFPLGYCRRRKRTTRCAAQSTTP